MQIAEVELLGFNYTNGAARVALQPANTSAFVGQSATFSVTPQGTPPYTVQWLSNGVPVAGATTLNYTTVPLTLSASNSVWTVAVSNSLGGIVSSPATLTVSLSPGVLVASSRGYSNKVFVSFVKPVVLASGSYAITNLSTSAGLVITNRSFGANQSEVVLSLDSALTVGQTYSITIDPVTAQDNSILAPTTQTFLHGYGGGITADFNAGLPVGGFIAGSATNGGPTGADGILHLTDDAQTGVCGTFYISNNVGPVILDTMVARWKSRVGGPLNGFADGYSFNWASDLPRDCTGVLAEEGAGSGVSFTIDTWDNGTGPDNGIEIKWKGARIAFLNIPRTGSGNTIIAKDVFVNVEASVAPNGRATFNYDSNVISAIIPNWPGITNGGAFLFAARTGGEADNMWIDDLSINTQSVGPVTITQSPVSATVLELTPAVFTVAADGSFPYTYQWYTNGVAMAGATNPVLTIASTAAYLTNASIYAVVANGFSSATSGVATLTVNLQPRIASVSVINSNTIAINYTRAVNLNSGTYAITPGSPFEFGRAYGTNHAQVIYTIESSTPLTLDTAYSVEITGVTSEADNSLILPNPSTGTFFFGYGRFCADFNDNLVPAKAFLVGTAGGGYITNGAVHLTDALGGQTGAFVVSNLNGGNLLDRFRVTYRVQQTGLGNPADGLSFNVANDVAYGAVGEDGGGSGLSLTFDSYVNDANDPRSIGVKWGGVVLTNFVTQLFFTGTNFVPVVVNMDPDGTLDLIYNNVVVFNNFPTPFRGIVNPRFNWSARTGGAVDAQWIDDVCINNFNPGPISFPQPPVSQTVLEFFPATFSATVDGTIPYTFRWITNGVTVPGAITTSLTIPSATAGLNGLQVAIVASNQFGAVTSSFATLNVNLAPRVTSIRTRGDSDVVVTWTRPVNLNGTYSFPSGPGEMAFNNYGASSNEVVVTLDTPMTLDAVYQINIQDVTSWPAGTTQLTNPTNFTFLHGYGAYSASFDGGVVPAGGLASGSAVASATDGYLHLADDAQTGVCGTFYISNRTAGARVDTLVARWRSRVGGALNGNADGYSFNWGNDLPQACGTFTAEEGAGTGLSFTVDTYDNGAGPDNGIEIKYGGARLAFLHVDRNGPGQSNYLTRDVFVDAIVTVDRTGLVTFVYDGNVVSATIPNWTGIANGAFLFAARTGGQADNMWIDDLQINTITLGSLTVTGPTNQRVTPNRSAVLTLGVSGLPPYTIQWYSNNVAIAGANTLSYRTANLQSGANGSLYFAVVSNYFGAVTSSVATVTVDVGPIVGGLAISQTKTNVSVSWTAPNTVLQAANNLTQPITWVNVSSTSPYVFPQFTTPTNLFFRLVEP